MLALKTNTLFRSHKESGLAENRLIILQLYIEAGKIIFLIHSYFTSSGQGFSTNLSKLMHFKNIEEILLTPDTALSSASLALVVRLSLSFFVACCPGKKNATCHFFKA